jgi:uncharacterized protein with PIN domain
MKLGKPYSANFHFFEELNDFLPHNKKNAIVLYDFDGNPSIKDAIEAQGVPHTEVDLIVVNNVSVGFEYHLKNGDCVEVFPVFSNRTVSPIVKLRDEPFRNPRFILDVHLGKLARLMRLLGFDALYRNDYDDPEIVQLSVEEHRAILTRDRQLLHAKVIKYGYWLRSTNPEEQVSEVINRFDLKKSIVPFNRCLVCNGTLEAVEKQAVESALEPKTKEYFNTFYRCIQCQKIYWKGSHFEKLAEIAVRLKSE